MCYQFNGRWGTEWQASKASTDYDIGDLLMNDGTNNVLATSAAENLVGICVSDKPSTDATTAKIAIKVPKDKSATFVAAVTGTFTAADEGSYFDLSDELTVNTAGTTYKVVRCVKYINATTGVFAINDPIS